MTCPDPIAGTLSGQAGPVSFTDVLSAASPDPEVLDYQGQLFAWLTDKTAACEHWRGNQAVPSERTLRFIQLKGWNNDPSNTTPLPYLTGTMQLGVVYDENGQPWPGPVPPGGAVHQLTAYYRVYGSRCTSYGDQAATAGAVTFSQVWDSTLPKEQQQIVADYDLTFPDGRFTGSVVAPRCVLCAPRPSKCSTV